MASLEAAALIQIRGGGKEMQASNSVASRKPVDCRDVLEVKLRGM